MLFLFRMGRLDRRISRAVTAAAVPLRLQGRLRRSERGFLLEMEDGHVWRLEGAQDFPPLVDATDGAEFDLPRDVTFLPHAMEG